MASEEPEFATRILIEENESSTDSFISHHRCCFHFPCFRRPAAHLTAAAGPSSSPPTSFWCAPPLLKLREWSEVVAGPQWKTFIRRFNRRNRNRHHPTGKFQYDPLSYALNFDEGPGQNGQFDEDYAAAVPMDLGKGAPAG